MKTEQEIEVLIELLFSQKYASENETNSPEGLYRLFSDTGLNFGFPVKDIYQVSHKTSSEKGLMKSILLQALFATYSVHQKEEQSKADFIEEVNAFYLSFLFQGGTPTNRNSALELLAHVLESRLTTGKSWFQGVMNKMFFSNFLYLDVMLFGSMLAGHLSQDVVAKIRKQWVFRTLWVIKKVASVDDLIQKEEQDLINSFLRASLLQAEDYKAFNKKNLDEIQQELFGDIQQKSWVLKRFLLDLAVLTAWSDKEIKNTEKEFLVQFCFMLGLEEKELDFSYRDVESFAEQFGGALPFGKDKYPYQEISQEYLARMGAILKKNQGRIRKEIEESKELVYLLNKSRKEPLTEEEKKKVRTQIIDILKTLPIFVIIALPFSFITLPVLLKILPTSALPSSFQDED